MGWERKRGKIEEFNRLLRGATRHELHRAGRRRSTILPAVRYCITLDSDTRLPRDAAKALIGIIAHPLNRPRFDRARSAASPRATASCSRASASRWRAPPDRCSRGSTPATPASIPTRPRSPTSTRICSAKASSPARASTTSTRSRRRSTGRVPENALLSHDLFEGLYARTALVTDVEVVDDYPVERARARAAPAPLGARRLADPAGGCFPFVPTRARACSATACRSSRAGRSSTTCGAAWWRRRRVAAARSLGWTVLPGSPLAWTAIASGRRRASRCIRCACCELLRGPAPQQPLARVPARPSSRICADRRSRSVVAAAHLPRQPGLRDGARDRRDARAPRRSRSAGCSSGRRPRRAPIAAGTPRLARVPDAR